MKRFKATISYDGSGFSGYQVQPAGRTVQGEIESILKRIHKGKDIRIAASGRTDAGVHAVGQVFHFDSPLLLDPENWKNALNAQLPEDIYVKEVNEASPGFHARFDAIKKEYRYRLLRSKEKDVFRRHYAYHYPHFLCTEKIKEAMKAFLGTHDFTSFSSAKSTVEDRVRTIYELELLEEKDEWIFRIVGNGFLYNMVRIIVGTLLDVGQGKATADDVKAMLLAQNRSLAGKTAPAHGLYLYKVTYKK